MQIANWLSEKRLLPRSRPSQEVSAAALIARADRARDHRDWPAAARDYAAGIKAGAPQIGHHVQLGHALKELGDYAGAEAAYRAFLDARPFDADIHLQLGHLFNKKSEPVEALQWYERAAQLAPQNADIAEHANRARRRALQAGGGRQRELAMKLVEQGYWHKARALLHDLVMVDGDEDLIGVLANVTTESGRFEEAAALYDRYRDYAQAHVPQLLPDVELQAGHLCKVGGDYAGALRHYIRARTHQFEQTGDIPDDAPYSREVQACMAEIYTCFWDGQSRA